MLEKWSPDLVSAMEQVDALQRRRWAFAWKAEGALVRVSFARGDKVAKAEADTLSLAICKAVMSAMLLEKNSEGTGE